MYRTATKLIDRWEIGPPTLQQYRPDHPPVHPHDPVAEGRRARNVNMRLGPDGKHLFIFGDEVTVLETANFTEVESWPFAAPTEPGLGRINLGPSHDFYDPPGTFTGLFTMADAVQKRRLMGIGRVDLVQPQGRLPADRTGHSRCRSPSRPTVTHKTGDYDDVIADSGIVVTPRSAYVLSLIVNDPTSSQTRALFGSISAAVYEVFARETSYAEFPSDLYLLFAAAALADEPRR